MANINPLYLLDDQGTCLACDLYEMRAARIVNGDLARSALTSILREWIAALIV
jgi:hypothetical protein